LQNAVDWLGQESSGPVAKDEIVKGYEYEKGRYVLIEPGELENLRVPSKHVVDVTQFIDSRDLDPEHIEKPLFRSRLPA
jgi:DNA end-binding protein Ku